MHAADAVALQAQTDLTTAMVNAAGRPVTANTGADLANLILPGGVYAAGPAGGKGALMLTGPLVLDGAGDPTTVFIFQTDSTLVTASSSTVSLINGAQECNVFWQVGSSATLGTNSNFSGNILASASITVTTGVTVHGRALASTGSVTLDSDTFVSPTCDLTPLVATTAPGAGTTTPGGGAGTTAPGGGTGTTVPGGGTGTTVPGGGTGTTALGPPRLVETGAQTRAPLLLATIAVTLGGAAILVGRRRTVSRN
jgi:hypothetical protein